MSKSLISKIFYPSVEKIYYSSGVIDLDRKYMIWTKKSIFNSGRFFMQLPGGWGNIMDSYIHKNLYNTENLIIKNCHLNIDSFSNSYPLFNVKNLFLYNCNKYFIQYYLNRQTFANVENIIFYCYPQSPLILNLNFPNMFIHPKYEKIVDKWDYHPLRVNILAEDDLKYIDKYLNLYEDEIKDIKLRNIDLTQ